MACYFFFFNKYYSNWQDEYDKFSNEINYILHSLTASPAGSKYIFGKYANTQIHLVDCKIQIQKDDGIA